MEKTDFNSTVELLEYLSGLKTPREFVETKGNVEYVKVEYMKYILNKFFRPWNWIILKPETIYIDEKPSYEKVHGKLTYTDLEGNTVSVDMVAAHRVQYNKDSNLVDPGNDTKAANTDCFKKACNFGLNIADDIYRAQTKIERRQYEELETLREEGAFGELTKEELLEKVDMLEINRSNFARELAGAKFRAKSH